MSVNDYGRPLRVGLVGTGAMGVVHSHAWRTVAQFFEVEDPDLAVVVSRDQDRGQQFAADWGWRESQVDVGDVVKSGCLDLLDITTPNLVHREQAELALAADIAVACEKPLGRDIQEARAMASAADLSGMPTFVWYNYRRVPAVTLARRLVSEGRLGRIFQVRAAYLQSWGSAAAHSWRFDASVAGTGAHGDINAHIIDTVRFITGREIVCVVAATQDQFVPSHSSIESTVDDVSIIMAKMDDGALATFEASRVATGYMSANRVEIHGESGAIRFDFERMNCLEYFDNRAAGAVQGWTRIHVTRGQHGHPYVDHWWPEGHGIGYGQTFINMASDILAEFAGGSALAPLPDFADALKTEEVLHAALVAAQEHAQVDVG